MEETGQNPWGERTKKMKLKGRKKKNKKSNTRITENKKAEDIFHGKKYLGGNNKKAVKVTAR